MSKLEKCPVCDGRGFVKGNFYDVAGQTCSFGDYAKKECSTAVCRYCNGNGIIEFEEKTNSFRKQKPITKNRKANPQRRRKQIKMKAIDKITKRTHSCCTVLGGYQVCVIPDVEWEDAKPSDVCVFTDEQFDQRFDINADSFGRV